MLLMNEPKPKPQFDEIGKLPLTLRPTRKAAIGLFCGMTVMFAIICYAVPGAPALVRDPLPELVDSVKVRDARSELDHNVQGERTHTGDWSGRNHRYAEDGGWFTYDMKVDTKTPLVLQCVYWGGDTRYFDIFVEGELIADVKLENPRPGQFITVS